MKSGEKEYAIIVRSKTRLEALTERFNTKSQTQFYIESKGGSFADYELEHNIFYESLNRLQSRLSKLIKYKTIDRSYLPSYLFNSKNLIIVIGQDGLVANTAKYSKNLPMVAVNPDPQRYDGVLLPFDSDDFVGGVDAVLSQNYQSKVINMAEARLNDGQRLLAFNDLFIGPSSHVSARYKISFNGRMEEQSSSGIIVSTVAGSTGWLSSIFNMAYGITETFNPKPQARKVKNKKGEEVKEIKKTWKRPVLGSEQLLFAVREPFKSIRTQADLVAGVLDSNKRLVLESFMPNYGVIFSDGIEKDFLQFNSGSIATIGLAKEKASLVLKP